eukprot:TRINITY_DN4004_c0_g2_i1.p1 TRINITY_DN4004_c0_g2~~TRINITY_DN4004_c0_g2_i1.p1  ORF type:complete len:142 (+),score=17.85 TRINITY_DN4004_c0_g2_i1:517-942(+)
MSNRVWWFFVLGVAALVGYFVYTCCTSTPAAARAGVGGGGYGGYGGYGGGGYPGGGGGGGGYGGNNYGSCSAMPPAQGPGFWTGLMGGAFLGRMMRPRWGGGWRAGYGGYGGYGRPAGFGGGGVVAGGTRTAQGYGTTTRR